MVTYKYVPTHTFKTVILTLPELHAVLILAGVIDVLVLFHLGVTVLFPYCGAVPYTTDTDDVSLVHFRGMVEELTLTRTGKHLIVNVSRTDVFVPGSGSGIAFFA